MNLSKACAGALLLVAPFISRADEPATPMSKGPIKVEIVEVEDGKWQLLRGGEPYYIRGAGGQTNLDMVVRAGGNSIRTWSVDNAEKVLDEAYEHGLTVMMGLWVGHERHGFDYNDSYGIAGQLERFREVVKKIKDHPALLMWGIGNECDLFYSNTNVWYAIEDIAKMIKEEDPNHPTTTVTAGLDVAEVQLIMERCPSLDLYSINTYGGLGSIPAGLRQYGYEGPYIVTEWGPNGHWEVAKTEWGAPIEQSSSEKARSYKERYQIMKDDKNWCLGSYVFLWGHKQETTSTWYGLFLPEGVGLDPDRPMPQIDLKGREVDAPYIPVGDARTAVMDEMFWAWGEKYPENRAPQVEYLKVDGKSALQSVYLDPRGTYVVTTKIVDAEGDEITYDWRLMKESTDIKAGGDAESVPDIIPGVFTEEKKDQVTLKAPSQRGAYRLFLYANDAYNGVATINIPVYVGSK